MTHHPHPQIPSWYHSSDHPWCPLVQGVPSWTWCSWWLPWASPPYCICSSGLAQPSSGRQNHHSHPECDSAPWRSVEKPTSKIRQYDIMKVLCWTKGWKIPFLHPYPFAHRRGLHLLDAVVVLDNNIVVVFHPSAVSSGRHFTANCWLFPHHLCT